jgi:geranylgeranyl pyrophosphate synthase
MVPKLNEKRRDEEEITNQVRKLLERKGSNALKSARNLMLEDERIIQSAEARRALRYFADECWSDLVRPTLISLACEAVGGDCEKVTSIAVPIMLFTGGIDIHDDIIDQSTTKNGRLTVFGKFGKDIALLIGDALLLKGLVGLHQALGQVETQKAGLVLEIIENTFFELGDAEALELPLRVSTNITPEEYLKIVWKKAADVEAYTHVSALLSDANREETEALRKYGRILGVLAIIRDDLIDMMDEEELAHRLENEVLPLPMQYAAQDPVAKAAINSIISEKRKTKKDLERIRQIVNKYKGTARTQQKIEDLVKEGLLNLNRIKLKRKELELLIDITKTT